MDLVTQKDGTVTTLDNHKKARNWEGGEQKPLKEEPVFALTTTEKVELRAFEKEYAKDIGEGARRDLFRQKAARELLEMRAENESRKLEGKDPIAKQDRRLTFKDGVVKSVHRAKEEMENNRQAHIARTNHCLDGRE